MNEGRIGWRRRVIGMGMVHADHLQAVAVEAFLRPPERIRIDQVAVARRVGAAVRERDELHGDLAIVLDRAADEAARLGRIVRLAVPADRGGMTGIEHEGHRRRSLR